MATVNIPSYHDDPNYRYKMPRVKAKIEGRGNGVKTNIMNMADIARALKRAPEYATKFCGCELGASSKFETAEGKAIVNGIHPEADVQTVIDKFVERFVLCPKCKLPEIDLSVVQGRVQGLCNACGYSGDMDNSHKVATFIVKNPPAVNVSTVGKKAAGEKDSATARDKRKSSKKEKPDEKKSKSGDKSKRSSEKSSSSKRKHHHHHHHHHERHNLSYTSEEIANVIDRLVHYLQKGDRPTCKDFFQEVRLLQVAQDFGGTLRVYCALMALYKSDSSHGRLTPEMLTKYEGYLAATCDRSIDGAMVLEALENFVAHALPEEAWNDYAVILSTLYQKDLLDEEAVLKRYGGAPPQIDPEELPEADAPIIQAASESSKEVDDGASSGKKSAKKPVEDKASLHAAQLARAQAYKGAAAFVQWLKEAESASESESEPETAVVEAKGVDEAGRPSTSSNDNSEQKGSSSSDSDDD